MISQAGFAAIDDLVHGFGSGYLPPVVPAPGQKARGHRVNGSLRAAARDQHSIGHIDPATTHTNRFGGYAEGRVEQSYVPVTVPGICYRSSSGPPTRNRPQLQG